MVSHKLITTSLTYLYNRNGTYYYRRRVPNDVKQHYPLSTICVSLKTKSQKSAERAATALSEKLESQWLTLRLGTQLNFPIQTQIREPHGSILFTDALELYIKLKASSKPKTFETSARRNTGYLVDATDNKYIDTYTSLDATKFRDSLLHKGLSISSLRRIFSSIKAIYNLAASEHGIEKKNPFSGIYIPEEQNVTKRSPASQADIIRIKGGCIKVNDEIRWLTALITDTGMRLSEAAGLYWKDIHLESDIPHLVVKPNPHRRLKTNSSKRTIPLVGASLWSIRKAKEASIGPYVFPKYMKNGECNANSASAAINKWLKSITTQKVSVHCLRHSMRDRLRSIECPAPIIDQIGGWSSKTVGEQYGEGYPIEILFKWMEKMS